MLPRTLTQVWKFHPVSQLPKHNSHSQLRAAGLRCKERSRRWSNLMYKLKRYAARQRGQKDWKTYRIY